MKPTSTHYRLRATEAARNGEDQWSRYYTHLANAIKLTEQPERHLGHNRWRQPVAKPSMLLRFIARTIERFARCRARRAIYRRYADLTRNES